MCGICGIVRYSGIGPAEVETVRTMTATLRHRGPDGDGLWHNDSLVIGHARLAIIDLSGGHQPMFSDDGDVAVTFNGEIYNYKELRHELSTAGHVFRTNTDTEVLIHGYEQWGRDVVRRLRGMFAFAIWSGREQTVLFARDRLGEKPLYYAEVKGDSGALVFASEIKAVVSHPGVGRAVNAPRLAEYLAYRSIAGDETLFAGVRALPPATMMIVAPGRRELHTYWKIDEPPEVGDQMPRPEIGERLLRDAVACRLMSDVGIGAITSGGLDSSLVSAVAIREAGRPLDTFCVGFSEEGFDERPFARRVAEAIGSRHHEMVLTANDIARELIPLTWAHDEPLTHPNSIPMHLIFRYAKEQAGVTVLLSGEGADELFGGYDWYRTARWRRSLRRLGPLSALVPHVSGRRGAAVRRLLAPDYLLEANAFSSPQDVATLCGGETLTDARRALWPTDRPEFDALFLYDQRTYLAPLLQRQDRMSMAAGVEARVVFLDHALVAWANSVPASDKVRGGERKALLKAIASRWIPDGIIRRPKVGFTLPLAHWMRGLPAIRERIESLRDSNARLEGFFDGAAIRRLVDAFLHAGDERNADLIWTVMSFDAWMEVFHGPQLVPVDLPGAFNGARAQRARAESNVSQA